MAHLWQVAGPEILIANEPVGSRITMTPVPAAPDAEVRYTVDGSEPTRESPLYTSPFFLTNDSVHTVSAVTVWRSGKRISPAVSRLILARSDDVIHRETLDFRLCDFFGDWDEPADTGIAYPTHRNLPLGEEGIVALRFSNIMVPESSTILFAQLQFGVGVEESRPARLKIEAELSPDPAPFATEPFATAARSRTSTGIEWDPGTWTIAQAAFGTQTPSLAPLLQEIIDQEGLPVYAPTLFLISGSGVREALSREWGPAIAPRLRIQFDRRSPLEIADEGNQFSVRFENTA